MRIVVAAAAIVSACGFASAARADAMMEGFFGGIVDNGTYTDSGPQNTHFAAGQTINGSFMFDETTDSFTSFEIGGYFASPGYTTVVSPPLAATAFAYIGVQNTVANAGPSNALQINFYYETPPGPSTVNIASFIANPGAFSQDLTGGSPSFFAAYLTNPGGSVTQVDGLLTSYAAPEPASLLLTLPGLAALGLIRRRFG